MNPLIVWARAETVANALAMVDGIGVTDTDSASEVLAGLTLGAGVEVKATANLRVRGEVMIDGFAGLPNDLSALSLTWQFYFPTSPDAHFASPAPKGPGILHAGLTKALKFGTRFCVGSCLRRGQKRRRTR